VTERRHSAEREQLAQKVLQPFAGRHHLYRRGTPHSVDQPGHHPDDRLRRVRTDRANRLRPDRFEEGQSAKEMSDQLALRGTWNGELAVTQKNGDDFPAGTRINRVDDPQSGMPAHYVWILADITERKQAEDRMRHIAQTDALTGLPNRMALLLRLAQLLPDARRYHWRWR
jgi:PAS domain-containing protein